MSMDTEEWKRIKTLDRTTETDQCLATGSASGRDVIFRTLFPGVFVYLAAYYIFVCHPSIADFYCKDFLQKPNGGAQPPHQIIMEQDTEAPAVTKETNVGTLA